MFKMEAMNAGPILEDLLKLVQHLDEQDCIYLTQVSDTESFLAKNALGISEAALPSIFQLLGIRSLIVSNSYDVTQLASLKVEIPAGVDPTYIWPYLRKDEIISELQSLFSHSKIIAFDNWAGMAGASNVWDGLLTDVIRPIDRKNFEFVFYLGDPGEKLSFQVGEALDIVTEFSHYGQVTFALDESEALTLWKMLNGVRKDTPLGEQTAVDLRKKYFSIFKTIDIAQVIIYSAENAMVFTDEKQFVIARKVVDKQVEYAPDARLNFVKGFSGALALHQDLAHSLILGLLAFECGGKLKATAQRQDMINYINEWLEGLQRTASIHLYE